MISKTSERIVMVNMINLVSPAPLRPDEKIIARESKIDQPATNLIATMARSLIASNSTGSA